MFYPGTLRFSVWGRTTDGPDLRARPSTQETSRSAAGSAGKEETSQKSALVFADRADLSQSVYEISEKPAMQAKDALHREGKPLYDLYNVRSDKPFDPEKAQSDPLFPTHPVVGFSRVRMMLDMAQAQAAYRQQA